MSASKCARCDKTVYPVEGLRCLDKLWHKGCFKCHECNMTLNMKNYKGFEKQPYCNAHCPQAKATTVADTPEIRRLAENTRIQSQAKYHEDFEKSKGKNFTPIADDPEMRRVKETSKIISNASYHGDMEKKKHMEEKRHSGGGQDEVPITRLSSNNSLPTNNNNNSVKHQNRMQPNQQAHQPGFDHHDMAQKQYQHQQQRLMQQQQLQMKQQYIQPAVNRQPSGLIESNHHQQAPPQHQQQTAPRGVQQHPYPPTNHHQQHIQMQLHHQQQQQQLLLRQQQHQQQIIMQQHRQSLDASIPISRQVSKQAIISSTDHPMMKHPNMLRGQPQQAPQQLNYMPLNHEALNGQPIPQHLVAGIPAHLMNHQMGPGGAMPPQNRRNPGPNSHPANPHQASQQHAMMQGYNPHQIGSMNGITPKQHAGHMQAAPHMIQHPEQLHGQQRLQMRPATIAGQPMQQLPHQVPRRVFRAMYDYAANDVDEVSFLENDILVDCVNVDRNWLIGKVARSGQTGMLPANYVEPLPSQ